LSSLLSFGYMADLTAYNGKCAPCILQNVTTNYYCTKTGVCTDTFVDLQSCEKGMLTCLSY